MHFKYCFYQSDPSFHPRMYTNNMVYILNLIPNSINFKSLLRFEPGPSDPEADYIPICSRTPIIILCHQYGMLWHSFNGAVIFVFCSTLLLLPWPTCKHKVQGIAKRVLTERLFYLFRVYLFLVHILIFKFFLIQKMKI